MFNLFKKLKPKNPPLTGYTYNLYSDMLSRPHLLIAGATGSGKSVMLNNLLHTSLFKDAYYIFLDCKGIELIEYKDLPQTIAYADSPEASIQALALAVDMMMNRYKQMQEQRTREYLGADVYVVIDEFADLMTTRKRDTVPLVQRLCQLGRATKIHVILCTQTVKAEILPTLIKCNFPYRVALRTASRHDSRMIIEQPGAELLPDPLTEHRAEMIYLKGSLLEKYNVPTYPDNERQRVLYYHLRYSA